MSQTKRKGKISRRINNTLLALLLITMAVMLGAFGINIYKIVTKDDVVKEPEVGIEPEKPENKEYFKELNAALDSGDTSAIASSVVKCFITEYYTWTNKDGNYDIGGMQYIFTDKQSDFEAYTRNNFYYDMDLYNKQVGTKNLIQVSSVNVNSSDATSFTLEDGSSREA